MATSTHLFFTFLTDEDFAAGVEEDDRGVEEFGLFGGEVGLVAEVEAVGAGEEGDREGGDRGIQNFGRSLSNIEISDTIGNSVNRKRKSYNNTMRPINFSSIA
jgi:hypothetical protein